MDNTNALQNNGMLVMFVGIIAAIIILVLFINFYLPFREERDYIKMEIERSLSEKERLYWEKQLKKLYLSCIPIFGRFFQ